MAKKVFTFSLLKRKKRKGVHAKSKSSNHKNSKNYKKLYNSQGK